MDERIIVYVYGADPVSQSGVCTQLRGRTEVALVDGDDPSVAHVAVVAVDEVDAHPRSRHRERDRERGFGHAVHAERRLAVEPVRRARVAE